MALHARRHSSVELRLLPHCCAWELYDLQLSAKCNQNCLIFCQGRIIAWPDTRFVVVGVGVVSISVSLLDCVWHADPSRCLVRLKVSERDPNHGQSQGAGGSRASAPQQSPAPQQYQALAPVSRSTGEAMQRAPSAGGTVIVTFVLTFQAEFGQRICIVGNCPGLGNWQHKAAPEMQWSDGHKWTVTVEVPSEYIVEYKYVVLQPDGLTALQWQQGNNAVLAILVRCFHFV